MSRNAVELTSLLVAPVPVVELLDPKWQRAAKRPSMNSALSADKRAWQALAVRDAVISGKLELLAPPTSHEVAIIHTVRGQCAAIGTQRAWRDAVRKIADYTTPFLSGSELDGMWSSIAATACYHESSDVQRQWADLLGAVARRDAGAVERSGTWLLEHAQPLELAEAEYVVTALAASYIQQRDFERARVLLASLPADSPNVLYRLPLQQLRTLAEHEFAASQRGSE
jgi:hypothetical protein